MSVMQYGRQTTVARKGDVTVISEETIFDYDVVKTAIVYTERVLVKDNNDVLAHFLGMLDRQKKGEIDQVGIQCLRNQDNGVMRIEKTWTIPQPPK